MFFKLTKKKKKQKRDTAPALVCFGVALFTVAGFFIGQQVYADLTAQAPVMVEIDPNIGVRPYVIEFFTDNQAEEMIPIIACESGFRHYDQSGKVLQNMEGSSAIGVAQILSSKHPDPRALEKYNRLHNANLTPEDFDITTLQANLGYALLLYKIRGTRDWECAKMV